MNTIGERIVFLREKHDISQKALAVSIQTTAATLSRYENNLYEPKGEVLARLAQSLHTTSDFLLGLSPDYRQPDTKDLDSLLTPEECRFLRIYRSLSVSDQIRVQERALSLLDNKKDLR